MLMCLLFIVVQTSSQNGPKLSKVNNNVIINQIPRRYLPVMLVRAWGCFNVRPIELMASKRLNCKFSERGSFCHFIFLIGCSLPPM